MEKKSFSLNNASKIEAYKDAKGGGATLIQLKADGDTIPKEVDGMWIAVALGPDGKQKISPVDYDAFTEMANKSGFTKVDVSKEQLSDNMKKAENGEPIKECRRVVEAFVYENSKETEMLGRGFADLGKMTTVISGLVAIGKVMPDWMQGKMSYLDRVMESADFSTIGTVALAGVGVAVASTLVSKGIAKVQKNHEDRGYKCAWGKYYLYKGGEWKQVEKDEYVKVRDAYKDKKKGKTDESFSTVLESIMFRKTIDIGRDNTEYE